MAHILSSWKEIGQYLGKAVRTVQRWERELELPVRRPASPMHRAVLAIPEELDAWMRNRSRGPHGAAVEELSRKLAGLQEEADGLRRRVETLERVFPSIFDGMYGKASGPDAHRKVRSGKRGADS